jgi:DNA-binding response OmpR family regulator
MTNNSNCIGKQVLIVDDDEAVLESMKLILEDEGYCVNTALDGKRMSEIMSKSSPDLIILDYRLPVKSGTLLTKELKKDSSTKHIPIVMVSSHNVALLAKEAGASDFFEKPFDIETLLDVVGRHLSA